MRLPKLANIAWRMRRRVPTFVSFNVTNRCTQRCPMCGVWVTSSEELSVAEIAEILSQLREEGIAAIEISGGEPFLRPDIFEVFSVLDQLGFVYSVNTNGTLLTPDVIERLASCTGLLQLAVSLDSLQRERYAQLRGTDSLPRVLASLELIAAARRRLPVKLNVAMSRVNRDEVYHILEFAKSRGLGMSAFPVAQGAGLAHRGEDAIFDASEDERLEMAELFRHLAVLRRAGEPLWEYSGYYEVAADYVSGRSIALCDAGRVFLDLRANGDLAACVDLPAFASLRGESLGDALMRVDGERLRIQACAQSTPCCYTCTANISETARHPLRFGWESALVWLRSAWRRTGIRGRIVGTTRVGH
jgi:cyclic pyranopterin phosphate synthase